MDILAELPADPDRWYGTKRFQIDRDRFEVSRFLRDDWLLSREDGRNVAQIRRDGDGFVAIRMPHGPDTVTDPDIRQLILRAIAAFR